MYTLFSYGKDSRLSPRIIRKNAFLTGKVLILKYGLKILFLLLHV